MVSKLVDEGDLVLVLGAGNIWETAREIFAKLKEDRG